MTNNRMELWLRCSRLVGFFTEFSTWPEYQNDLLRQEYEDLFYGTNAAVYVPLWASVCKYEDGSLLDSYNTQQHWMRLGEELYLVYTRRGANNDHVFRHRAPLFAARVENMKLVRDSEFAVVPERGARLGNFGITQLSDNSAMVMAAEWMQPKGCEAYGSDNTIWACVVECE